jgi:chemotaxis methyl-accepting protein methylase
MPLRPDQIETFLKTVRERTLPPPLARPLAARQVEYVDQRLDAAFESIGMKTVSDQALQTALRSDTYLYTLRERALYVQPAELLSRKFFRFRARMPTIHTMLVRLFTDAAGLGQRKIRIWNPGCGFGADTYSLTAMACLARNATGASATAIEVIGTDLLPDALKYAETARYEFMRSEWKTHREQLVDTFGEDATNDDDRLPVSSQHLPAGVEPFFDVHRLPENGYTITPAESLRQATRFRLVNVLRMDEIGQLGGFDVVVCFARQIEGDTDTPRRYRDAIAYGVRAGGFLLLPESITTPPDVSGAGAGLEMVEPGLFCRLR